MELISHLRCCFKRIQEKNIRNVSLRGLSFICCRLNVYRGALIFRNFPCYGKFLVTRLFTIVLPLFINLYNTFPSLSPFFSASILFYVSNLTSQSQIKLKVFIMSDIFPIIKKVKHQFRNSSTRNYTKSSYHYLKFRHHFFFFFFFDYYFIWRRKIVIMYFM